MKLQSIALSFALCGVLLSSAAGAAESAAAPASGSADAGQTKSTPCLACHGVGGNSVNPVWPVLAGQHQEYIVKQLKAFKNDERVDPLMTPMAKALSDEDMLDLGAYFSAQTATGTLEAEPSKVSEGQRLYRGGEPVNGVAACAACHGPAGAGNPTAKYPSIRGQHSAYVAAQLKAYRSGTRKTDQPQNQMMRNIAAKLSDVQIDAVAAYVQGLR